MDALTDFKGDKGSGLFLKFTPDEGVKLRILTNDPLVNKDKWGNTRYSFVVWNFNEDKAQILSKGMSILRQLQELHTSDEWGGDIRKINIRITSTGEGMETRYTVMPLPNSTDLTNDQVKQASHIKLEDTIQNGIRLSQVNGGSSIPEAEYDEDHNSPPRPSQNAPDPVIEDIPDEIDLSEIPFGDNETNEKIKRSYDQESKNVS